MQVANFGAFIGDIHITGCVFHGLHEHHDFSEVIRSQEPQTSHHGSQSTSAASQGVNVSVKDGCGDVTVSGYVGRGSASNR